MAFWGSTIWNWIDSRASFSVPYPMDRLPGHAAWLDWPWKLDHIQDKTGSVVWELYLKLRLSPDLASEDFLRNQELLESCRELGAKIGSQI